MHNGVVEATQRSTIIGNLSPDTNGYDFRVAAVLLDGYVGEFSSPLLVATPESSKQSLVLNPNTRQIKPFSQ